MFDELFRRNFLSKCRMYMRYAQYLDSLVLCCCLYSGQYVHMSKIESGNNDPKFLVWSRSGWSVTSTKFKFDLINN